MVRLDLLDEYIRKYLKETGKKLMFVLEEAKISKANFYNRMKGVGEFTASEMYGLKLATEMSEEDFRRIFFAGAAEFNSTI